MLQKFYALSSIFLKNYKKSLTNTSINIIIINIHNTSIIYHCIDILILLGQVAQSVEQ